MREIPTIAGYSIAAGAVVGAVVLRLALDPFLGDGLPFITMFAAVAFVAWLCGRGPAIAATLLGGASVSFFIMPPRLSFSVERMEDASGLVVYGVMCSLFVAMFEAMRQSQQRILEQQEALESEASARRQAQSDLAQQEELLRVTLQSIGDGVIATDTAGNVTFLNHVAEQLTRWTSADAAGKPLDSVFRIINETTRQPADNPAHKALRQGMIVGLANHTILIDREGGERAIDDSAAPIVGSDGQILGCVLVFRDVTERRHADEALRQSEAAMRAFYENAPVFMGITEPIGDDVLHVYDNPSTCRFFGVEPGSTSGKMARRDLNADQKVIDIWLEKYRECLAERGPVHFQHEMNTPAGPRWLSVTVSPIDYSASGRPRFCYVSEDITDRKLAESRERSLLEQALAATAKFEAVFNQSGIFAGIMDLDGKVLEVNDLSVNWCGYKREDVLNRPFWETPWWRGSKEVQQRIREASRKAAEGHEFREVFPYWVADGTQRIVDFAMYPIRNGVGQVVFLHPNGIDITEQRNAESELRRLNIELREHDRRKDEFLATLAHELRNPLAPVRNSLELMKRVKGNAALIEHSRAMIERQISQMVRLVDDLLDMSRITLNKLDIKRERVQLATVVQHAAEACQPMIDEFRHHLDVELPPEPIELDGDPVRLTQVFLNLLSNSCKYTPPGGRIRLSAKQDGGSVIISVKDDGIGIPPDKLESVFGMFTQVDRSLEKSQGGLGIGLTLVKRLVRMHGGSVEAMSEGPGKGSEFVVRLPVQAAEDTPENASSAAPAATRPRRILVVDDNEDAATSLAMLLKLLGHDVHLAFDGEQAIEAVASHAPEVVLLDLGLPKLNGFDVCRKVRQLPQGEEIVMVALTGWGQDGDRRKSKEAGFDGHLVKPVSQSDLTKYLVDGHPKC